MTLRKDLKSIQKTFPLSTDNESEITTWPRLTSDYTPLPAIGTLGNCCGAFLVWGFDELDIEGLKKEIHHIRYEHMSEYTPTDRDWETIT